MARRLKASGDRIEPAEKLSYQRCRVKQLCSPLDSRIWPMTAENQNEGPSNEGRDQRNLSIQGSADESINVVGDRNTVHQGPSYTTHVVSSFEAEQLRSQRRYLRRALLKQMRTDVAQRLEDSLHNLIRVDLEQEEQRYQVGRRRKLPLVEVIPTSIQVSHRLVQRELEVSNNSENGCLFRQPNRPTKYFTVPISGGVYSFWANRGPGKPLSC
ncbi:MAG: hypothetical protein AAGC93_22100 [Cyanobacteria bacterium P01_F01_bin.53]